jgi:D-beta-D-heptose 7-phosphate kinase/D-beta-D-heptose 1-phosphate adenosyltransferase
MNNLKKKEFQQFNVLVIGDFCYDEFVYGTAVRLAPEAPVPVFNPTNKTLNKGMAGNVVENLHALGIETYSEYNGGVTPTKTRYVDERSGQILLRVDTNDKVKRIDEDTLKSIANNKYRGITVSAIVISDYDKGFLEEEDIDFICKNNSNVFIDTKKILGSWCKYSSFIKINHVEYQRTEYTIQELGIENKMIITLSSKGCQHKGKIYPVEKVQIRDVSGAGDTFLSGLVAEYVLTKDIEKAIKFAQECATVPQVQNSTSSRSQPRRSVRLLYLPMHRHLSVKAREKKEKIKGKK